MKNIFKLDLKADLDKEKARIDDEIHAQTIHENYIHELTDKIMTSDSCFGFIDVFADVIKSELSELIKGKYHLTNKHEKYTCEHAGMGYDFSFNFINYSKDELELLSSIKKNYSEVAVKVFEKVFDKVISENEINHDEIQWNFSCYVNTSNQMDFEISQRSLIELLTFKRHGKIKGQVQSFDIRLTENECIRLYEKLIGI